MLHRFDEHRDHEQHTDRPARPARKPATAATHQLERRAANSTMAASSMNVASAYPITSTNAGGSRYTSHTARRANASSPRSNHASR